MTDLIKKKDGSPFPTERSANLRRGILAKQGTETQVVESEGGFALEVISASEPQPKRRRKKRAKLGRRNVLTFPPVPGYATRVVNDVDDRVVQLEEEDWEVVQESELPAGDRRAGGASRMGAPVRVPVGGGVHGVFMKKRQEWFDEDQAEKQAEIDKVEASMKRDKGGIPGAYGEVKIA